MHKNLTLNDKILGVGNQILHNLRQSLTRHLGDRAAACLQEAGFAAGEQVYECFLAWLPGHTGLSDPANLDSATLGEVLSAFFQSLGWGELTLKQAGKGALVITAPQWAEADPAADSLQPSCYVTSGLLTSFLGRISTVPVAVMEVECRTRTDEHCRFIAGAPSTLDAVFGALANGESYESVLTS